MHRPRGHHTGGGRRDPHQAPHPARRVPFTAAEVLGPPRGSTKRESLRFLWCARHPTTTTTRPPGTPTAQQCVVAGPALRCVHPPPPYHAAPRARPRAGQLCAGLEGLGTGTSAQPRPSPTFLSQGRPSEARDWDGGGRQYRKHDDVGKKPTRLCWAPPQRTRFRASPGRRRHRGAQERAARPPGTSLERGTPCPPNHPARVLDTRGGGICTCSSGANQWRPSPGGSTSRHVAVALRLGGPIWTT